MIDLSHFDEQIEYYHRLLKMNPSEALRGELYKIINRLEVARVRVINMHYVEKIRKDLK